MKMLKLLVALILTVAAFSASAGVCNNTSISGTFTGISTGGAYDTSGLAGPYQFTGRYAFAASTANTTSGTVTITGVVLDGAGARGAVSTLNGSYTVNAASCYATITYKLYGNGSYLSTVSSVFYLGSLTNPAAPAANIAYALDGLEMFNAGTYHWQWTTALKRIYK